MTNPLMPLIEAMAKGRRYEGDGEARRIIRTLISELDRVKALLPDEPACERCNGTGYVDECVYCDGTGKKPVERPTEPPEALRRMIEGQPAMSDPVLGKAISEAGYLGEPREKPALGLMDGEVVAVDYTCCPTEFPKHEGLEGNFTQAGLAILERDARRCVSSGCSNPCAFGNYYLCEEHAKQAEASMGGNR